MNFKTADSRDFTPEPPCYIDPHLLHQLIRLRKAQIAIRFGRLINQANLNLERRFNESGNPPTNP